MRQAKPGPLSSQRVRERAVVIFGSRASCLLITRRNRLVLAYPTESDARTCAEAKLLASEPQRVFVWFCYGGSVAKGASRDLGGVFSPSRAKVLLDALKTAQELCPAPEVRSAFTP